LCATALVGVTMHRARARTIEPIAALAEAAVNAPSFTIADALRVLEAHADAEAVAAGVPERDLWLHPLAGPMRRLPVRASRKFRAPRDGLRPDECGSGHCGVDLGEESGEWIFAAHDGVVERVVWEDVGAGGRYVRLNHRGGTLTTSYMHLGTIRSELRPGVPVRAGDPIGTVGDTGINHSGPHLHFQIGVRAHPGDVETFIDPEPLLLTWALRPPLPERPARKLARSLRIGEEGPQGM
jgi:murein DD-endopeptidase MepM/ murein hydrolase activator NlpD